MADASPDSCFPIGRRVLSRCLCCWDDQLLLHPRPQGKAVADA